METLAAQSQDLYQRWRSLDLQQLTAERETWRQSTLQSLKVFRAQWDSEVLAQIAQELQASYWTAPIQERDLLIERVRDLQNRLAAARQDYLLALGPTRQPSVNSILLQLELLQEEPERTASAGCIILNEVDRLSTWGAQLGGSDKSESLKSFTQTLEQVAFALLQDAVAEELRERVLQAWDTFLHDHNQERTTAALSEPTRSPRWNSWILLLKEVEAGRESPELLFDALQELDVDLEEIEDSSSGESVQSCLQDYFEASRQLRLALQEGRKLKGWTQIMPPILEEIDTSLVEIDSREDSSTSQIARLCQSFEDSQIDPDKFQRGLEGFRKTLGEARRQANLAAKDLDPQEQSFAEALAKLEKGLETLQDVESPSQGRQLSQGCALIEEGLEELRQLQG